MRKMIWLATLLVLSLTQLFALPQQTQEKQQVRHKAPAASSEDGSGWLDSFFADADFAWFDDWLDSLADDDPTSRPAVVPFDYDFKKKSEGKDWKQVAGRWKVRKGVFLARRPKNNSFNSVAQRGTYADFDYSARVQRTDSTDPFSIAVAIRGVAIPDNPAGQNTWRSGYFFQYTNTGFVSVWRIDADGSARQLLKWKASSAVNRGTWNVLRVVAAKGKMTFFINGQRIWRGKDGTYKNGEVGVEFFKDPGRKGKFSIDWARLSGSGDPPDPEPQISMCLDLDDEEVHIRNKESKPLVLTDWFLRDNNNLHKFTFVQDRPCRPSMKGFTLGAGKTVIVTSGDNPKHSPPGRIVGWCNDVWNNGGDTARLFNSNGKLVVKAKGKLGSC